jgi:GntR family transcriptional regulator
MPAIPQYRRIEHVLRQRIAAGRAGDALPSDADLCAEFGVSRMTARNAMQRLAEEGLLIRAPGRGSFIAEPPVHRRANRLMTFSDEMRRRGMTPVSTLILREVRPSSAVEAADLGLEPGEPVVVVRRLRSADGRPMAIETAVMDRRVEAAVMTADLVTGSLHEALRRAGHVLHRGAATIRAEAARGEDAAALGVRLGSPLLVERRVIRDVAGRRIEATESRYPADRYALDVSFDVDRREVDGGG